MNKINYMETSQKVDPHHTQDTLLTQWGSAWCNRPSVIQSAAPQVLWMKGGPEASRWSVDRWVWSAWRDGVDGDVTTTTSGEQPELSKNDHSRVFSHVPYSLTDSLWANQCRILLHPAFFGPHEILWGSGNKKKTTKDLTKDGHEEKRFDACSNEFWIQMWQLVVTALPLWSEGSGFES